MGSVCGQHDFIDLVGLNNAIFWGCKRVCVTVHYGNMNEYKHQARIYYVILQQNDTQDRTE